MCQRFNKNERAMMRLRLRLLFAAPARTLHDGADGVAASLIPLARMVGSDTYWTSPKTITDYA
jgi:hypothetical protein